MSETTEKRVTRLIDDLVSAAQGWQMTDDAVEAREYREECRRLRAEIANIVCIQAEQHRIQTHAMREALKGIAEQALAASEPREPPADRQDGGR